MSARWPYAKRRSAPSTSIRQTALTISPSCSTLRATTSGRGHSMSALNVREKALGHEHPDTTVILGNLANLLKDQGDYAGARPLFERALAINEKTLGPEHLDTAISLSGLAILLHAEGDYEGARPLHERALAVREKALQTLIAPASISLVCSS
jgi:tetratricopeptide (TPR) repeat protein